MNIETLHDHINTFTHEVLDSGFKRDLDDYIASLPSVQANIMAQREIAEKMLSALDHLYGSDLPDSLRALLPEDEIRPFVEESHHVKLRNLIEDKEIQQAQFFTQLTQFLNELRQQLLQNVTEIDEIETFIAPYLTADTMARTDQGLATISIVFKEQRTISSLGQFTKTLRAWNRALPIYHQLLKSKPPEDTEIVEVQNGTIDLVVNLDVAVAMDLVKLFTLGFEVFGAYLTYMKIARPIIDTFHGNKKLIGMEDEREKLLLDNIGIAVKNEITRQHSKARKSDKEIDKTSVSKKAEVVTKLVTSHIVKGNDIKLLALPEAEVPEGGHSDVPNVGEDLRKRSMAARQQLRLIPAKAQQKLLQAYGQIDEEEPEEARGA